MPFSVHSFFFTPNMRGIFEVPKRTWEIAMEESKGGRGKKEGFQCDGVRNSVVAGRRGAYGLGRLCNGPLEWPVLTD